MNVQLVEDNMNFLNKLLFEYKDVFTWTSKDLKGIPSKIDPTLYWIGHIDSTCTLGHVLNESKLCCNYLIGHKHIVNNWISIAYRGSYLVITDTNSFLKESKLQNLCRLEKTKCSHK